MDKKDKTNAMRLLDAKKIPCEGFTYDPAVTDGEQVAALLGEDARTVFKTLVTVSDKGEHIVFCVPVCASLDRGKGGGREVGGDDKTAGA